MNRSFARRMACLSVLVAIACAAPSPPIVAAADDSTSPRFAEPEEALVEFFLAMVAADKERLEAVMLPARGASILWEAGPPPDEVRERFEADIKKATFRRLQAGDEFLMPDGKKRKLAADEVSDVRVWLQPDEDPPIPLIVEKHDDQWRVDARPLIAARTAAKKAREEKQPPPQQPEYQQPE